MATIRWFGKVGSDWWMNTGERDARNQSITRHQVFSRRHDVADGEGRRELSQYVVGVSFHRALRDQSTAMSASLLGHAQDFQPVRVSASATPSVLQDCFGELRPRKEPDSRGIESLPAQMNPAPSQLSWSTSRLAENHRSA